MIYNLTMIFIAAISLNVKILAAKDVVFGGLERDTYYIDVLKHALSYSPNKNYQVVTFKALVPKPRVFDLLAEGVEVDVITGSATQERETLFKAIYFPILKGVKGWRIPIIPKSKPHLFEKIQTKSALTSLVPIQFHTWTSTKVFEYNNITVATGSNYTGIFNMLAKERADYLPRSILDVQRDMLRYEGLGLMLDPYIIIKYPSAYYFYVNKENSELAFDINLGLEKALADGSFDALFYKHFGTVFKDLSISTRHSIELVNPFILDTLPLKRVELWGKH